MTTKFEDISRFLTLTVAAPRCEAEIYAFSVPKMLPFF